MAPGEGFFLPDFGPAGVVRAKRGGASGAGCCREPEPVGSPVSGGSELSVRISGNWEVLGVNYFTERTRKRWNHLP